MSRARPRAHSSWSPAAWCRAAIRNRRTRASQRRGLPFSFLYLHSALGRLIENVRGVLAQTPRQIAELARRGAGLAHQALQLEQTLLAEMAKLRFALLREAIHALRRLRQVVGRLGQLREC